MEARKARNTVLEDGSVVDLLAPQTEEDEGSPERKKTFELSMLKTRLQHEVGGLVSKPPKHHKGIVEATPISGFDMDNAADTLDDDPTDMPIQIHIPKENKEKDEATLKTLSLARVAVARWKRKVETSKSGSSSNNRLRVHASPKKKRSRKSSQHASNMSSKPRSRFDSERGGLSDGSGRGSSLASYNLPEAASMPELQNASGRTSRARTNLNKAKKPPKSLVPCKGPGQLLDYTDYVKEGIPNMFSG